MRISGYPETKDSPKFSDIFLFETSPKLREKLEREQGYNFELVLKDYNFELWKSK
jgi:hypothetical protein